MVFPEHLAQSQDLLRRLKHGYLLRLQYERDEDKRDESRGKSRVSNFGGGQGSYTPSSIVPPSPLSLTTLLVPRARIRVYELTNSLYLAPPPCLPCHFHPLTFAVSLLVFSILPTLKNKFLHYSRSTALPSASLSAFLSHSRAASPWTFNLLS